jgi:hypothetical protein
MNTKLQAMGFSEEETGGGCAWLRKPIGNGLALCITDGEAGLPETDKDSCSLYLMSDEHGEPLMERHFSSVEDAAEVLGAIFSA